MNAFIPKRHERIERRKEKNATQRKNQNQPQPEIYAITLFRPRGDDLIHSWHINPKKKLDIEKVAEALKHKTGVDLYVAEALFEVDHFDVYTRGEGVPWRDVLRCTTEALQELSE